MVLSTVNTTSRHLPSAWAGRSCPPLIIGCIHSPDFLHSLGSRVYRYCFMSKKFRVAFLTAFKCHKVELKRQPTYQSTQVSYCDQACSRNRHTPLPVNGHAKQQNMLISPDAHSTNAKLIKWQALTCRSIRHSVTSGRDLEGPTRGPAPQLSEYSYHDTYSLMPLQLVEASYEYLAIASGILSLHTTFSTQCFSILIVFVNPIYFYLMIIPMIFTTFSFLTRLPPTMRNKFMDCSHWPAESISCLQCQGYFSAR